MVAESQERGAGMRLLFCCEFYYPSVGGVQEVMRQIAERMVQFGHEVTVATTRLAERKSLEHHGVRIVEFAVTGNDVRGVQGEADRYRDFVLNFDGDALLIKAAQQWTFDALWPVLDRIRLRKVFIPCGFSALYEPSYQGYFERLPDVLRAFDHLIFYAECYRDVDFARSHGIANFTILPNGASEVEFGAPRDPGFRARHGIADDSFVFLTVGSLTGVKGHREVAAAFAKLQASGRKVTLILNGNAPPAPVVGAAATSAEPCPPVGSRLMQALAPAPWLVRLAGRAGKIGRVLRDEGWKGVQWRVKVRAADRMQRLRRRLGDLSPTIGEFLYARDAGFGNLDFWIERARRQAGKQVLCVDLPRAELVQAFGSADLFVFASNIEYSPLVLFESAAAGTPFLTVPVGNAEEITRWTGGGVICPAPRDDRGYTRAEPRVLAREMAALMADPQRLKALGQTAHRRWSESFSWLHIARRYESILRGACDTPGNSEGRAIRDTRISG